MIICADCPYLYDCKGNDDCPFLEDYEDDEDDEDDYQLAIQKITIGGIISSYCKNYTYIVLFKYMRGYGL